MTPYTGVVAERTASSPPPGSTQHVDNGLVTEVPARAAGVLLLGEMEGSGYRRPPALVRRADGQTITLSRLLYLTLEAMDGRRGYADIARVLTAAVHRRVIADDVGYLVEKKLRPLGLVRGPDGAEPHTSKMNPLLALRFKFVVSNPALTRRVTAPFAWLFRPAVALPVLALFAFASWWILFEKGLASATHQAFYEPGMILAVWTLIVASAGFHEFGHAAACRYGGATPGAMGAGLYLVWPAFYTDVTDCYRLGRGDRLRVDLGGLYFNAIFAVVTLAGWVVLRWDALLLVVAAQHLQMVRQLAPFIRADGYHIVADLTGVPDLFAHIKPTLLGVLPRRWRPASARSPALKRWARAVVVGWVALVVPLLAGLIGLGVLLLPRLAATAWDSMGEQWAAAGTYWTEGDLAGVLVRGLSALIVLLPVLGLVYLLARIARRTGGRAWRATEDNPAGRVGVVLLAAAVAASVAWAWWPHDQYRPIDGDETWTVPAVAQQVEDRRVFLPLLSSGAPSMLSEGQGELPPYLQSHSLRLFLVYLSPLLYQSAPGSELQPGRLLTSRSATAPDGVSSPAGGTSERTPGTEGGTVGGSTTDPWPFPFPSPPEPSEGDNRAEAVNTTDGSVVTDLAVAWAIVTADEVTDRNEAYALANCRDCLTIAVAFQVLLLVSDAHTVTPLNAAVAANYDCTRCVTEAIAVQLVVSLTGMPSEQAQEEIAAAMAKVEALGQDLSSLSGGQVYYVLQATQAEIMRVLDEDGVLPDAGDTAQAQADEATAHETTSVQSSPPATDAGTGDDAQRASGDSPTTEAGASEGTATSDASSEPTGEPTSEPTSEPTGEPTSEPTSEPSATASSEPAASAEPSPTASTSP